MKKLLIISMLFLFVISLFGCSNSKPDHPEEVKQIVLDYLYENYPDDTFIALGYTGENWTYDYKVIYFQSEKYSDSFEVRVFDEDNEPEYIIKDEYFKLAMKEDAEEFFKSLVSEYNSNVVVKVNFISPELPENLATNANFSDYLSSEKCNMEVYFISNKSFKESDIKSILSSVCDSKIMGHFRFVVTSDECLLEKYTISEIVNEIGDSIIEKTKYSINNHFEITQN